MTNERKRKPPPSLDVPFGEALARFARTDPAELGHLHPPSSGEAEGGKRRMSKEPKPFVFTLNFEEAQLITGAAGSGGHQELHRRITEELENNDNQVTFTDEQLGELIRYMTRYGSGGFQDRLRRAFNRSLADLLGFRMVP